MPVKWQSVATGLPRLAEVGAAKRTRVGHPGGRVAGAARTGTPLTRDYRWRSRRNSIDGWAGILATEPTPPPEDPSPARCDHCALGTRMIYRRPPLTCGVWAINWSRHPGALRRRAGGQRLDTWGGWRDPHPRTARPVPAGGAGTVYDIRRRGGAVRAPLARAATPCTYWTRSHARGGRPRRLRAQPDARWPRPRSATRGLPYADASADAVLLLGPLYHRSSARTAAGAHHAPVRVRRGAAGAAISRFASMGRRR